MEMLDLTEVTEEPSDLELINTTQASTQCSSPGFTGGVRRNSDSLYSITYVKLHHLPDTVIYHNQIEQWRSAWLDYDDISDEGDSRRSYGTYTSSMSERFSDFIRRSTVWTALSSASVKVRKSGLYRGVYYFKRLIWPSRLVNLSGLFL